MEIMEVGQPVKLPLCYGFFVCFANIQMETRLDRNKTPIQVNTCSFQKWYFLYDKCFVLVDGYSGDSISLIEFCLQK
jgi:hypothetical protein